MQLIQKIFFIIIFIILVVRGIWPQYFNIDRFSIALLLLLAIPLLAPYLKKAKWFGIEFVFKDEIKKINDIVEKVEQKAKEAEKGASRINIFETFSTKNALKLLNSDPSLSLAALRINIEKVLTDASNKLLDVDKRKKSGNRFYISKLLEEGIVNKEQGKALNSIISVCNKAIHGAQVSKKEAREIIKLAERLNKSFAVGYSINFKANKEYAQQGLLCEWEHCVEHSPLTEEVTELSCPVFGHNCPGGLENRQNCYKSLNDILKNRFIE